MSAAPANADIERLDIRFQINQNNYKTTNLYKQQYKIFLKFSVGNNILNLNGYSFRACIGSDNEKKYISR